MRLEWIAATLNPRDVAPHPNFPEKSVTPPQLFALLLQMRLSDFDSLRQRRAGAGKGSSEPSWDDMGVEVVDAARKAINAATTEEGASRLIELGASNELPLDCAAAALLFGAAFASEQDNYEPVLAGLYMLRDRLRSCSGPESLLLRAAVAQQIALRRLEVGEASIEDAQEARDAASLLHVQDLLRLTKGVLWGSDPSMTLDSIREELIAVSDAHVASETMRRDRSSSEWQRIVRARAPYLTLLESRDTARSLERYVQEEFEEHTGSLSRTLHVGDAIEGPMYAALLHYEVYGDAGRVIRWRSLLGKLRLLRTGKNEVDEIWLRADAIRMLRQSDDMKSLELALRYTRSNGPLESVVVDARQILRQRLQQSRLRRAELAVLGASAHLLDRNEALVALEAVLNCISNGVMTRAWRWEDPSIQLESAWMAAVSLAGPAEELDQVASLLLAAAQNSPEGDQLMVGALSRPAIAIEWEGVADSTRDAWAQWLRESSTPMALAMLERVGTRVGAQPDVGGDVRSVISQAATVMNWYVSTGARPSEEEVSGYVTGIAEQLENERVAASRRTYRRSSVSTCEVAVGYAVYLGVDSLWDPVVGYLVDPQVDRHEKSLALERLARWQGELPAGPEASLRRSIGELLFEVSPDPFDGGIVPFPEALRLGARHGMISDANLLKFVARLAGSREARQRVEAARTLSITQRSEAREPADWVAVMTLQLMHDAEALVRAEAGRAAASVVDVHSRYGEVLGSRLVDLLGEDGLVVPLLVLRGLQDVAPTKSGWPEALVEEVQRLAGSHPARGVRLQADAIGSRMVAHGRE